MLTRAVRIRLGAFLAIALLSIAYLGYRYVGFSRWLGASGYTVHVNLADAGGIFTNAEVDYRGVPIGRVGGMRLTASGIQVDARITSDDRIPRDVLAVVADRSVIGEQYLDLRPRTASGPYLANGATIDQGDTQLPPPVQELLMSAESFATSVPVGALQTTIGELYNATEDVSSSVSTLVSSSTAFTTSLKNVLPQTITLFDTSKTVLGTQNRLSLTIQQFAHNLRLIGAQFKKSDGDISTVLSRLGPATGEVSGLFGDINGSLHDLLANLLTTSAVFFGRQDGLREVLVNLPVAVTIGGKVTTPQGINVGLVPTFFDPLPCTAGYGGTSVRTGLNTSGDPPLNTNASCTAQGVNLRGSQHAPNGGQR